MVGSSRRISSGSWTRGARQGQLLLHPTGQLCRKPASKRCQAGEGEELLPSVVKRAPAVDAGEKGEVFLHREVTIQRKPLRQVADTPVDAALVSGKPPPEDRYVAGVGRENAREGCA